MKQLYKIFGLLILSLFFWSCSNNELNPSEMEIESLLQEDQSADVLEGVIRVKFSPELGDAFYTSSESTSSIQVRSIGNDALGDYMKAIGAKSMQRVFPNTGKFEERKRREGLHLWYDITFDESIPTTRAVSEAHNLEGVDIVEAVRLIPIPNNKVTLFYPNQATATRAGEAFPFNDPGLRLQWHYDNRGEKIRHVQDADINLFKAWEVEVGKPNVVVAVIDGGIDLQHEDLKDNIYWKNPGFNFVTNTPEVTPVPHGTHVAGTVAARNNNGIGVCGVAGGDNGADSGIRLMSCQVFYTDPKTGSSSQAKNFGEAFIYAADNGAVITQNSWGYGYPGPGTIDPSVQAAIDYFIKYAGCDENGNQLPDSPMKGGVVIFAAGNDGEEYDAWPGAYSEVIAVSAMAPNFTRTDYTNRGVWVDIMAPGGSVYFDGGQVLSTLPDNKYGYMEGTSMACPHVSGIAALVVSKYGGKGFTNTELKNRLINSILPENIYIHNPKDKGKLGNGYIDAYGALAKNQGIKPDAVASVEVTPDNNSGLNMTFKAVADKDDKTASNYNIYISTNEIKAGDLSHLTPIVIPAHSYKVGDLISHYFGNLEFGTSYYIAVVAVDRWGLTSDPLFVEAKTNTNQAPVLTPSVELPIRIAESESQEFTLKIEDADQHSWSFEVSGEKRGVSYERVAEGILFRITGIAPVGSYKIHVKVADYYFAESLIDIPFEIYANHAPKLMKSFETIYVSTSASTPKEINIDEYFSDEDGDALTYKVSTADPDYLKAELGDKNKLRLQSLGNKGNTVVYIDATDTHGKSARAILSVRIVENNFVHAVYPVPVSKELNLVVNDDVKKLDVEIRTPDGILTLKKEITLDAGAKRHIVINVESIPVGTYVLMVKGEQETYKTTFAKI